MIFPLGMAWTQDEIDQVRAAIVALATGARVVSVSYAGPPARSVTYHATDLKTLRDLKAEMEQSAAAAAGRPTYRLAATRKGLGQ